MIYWILAIILISATLVLKPYISYLIDNKGKDFPIIFYPLQGFIGQIFDFTKMYGDLFIGFEKLIKKNPNTKALLSSLGPFKLYALVDPEYIKSAMIDHYHLLVKSKIQIFNELIFSQGIALSEGEIWKKQRKFLVELFHHKKLNSYIETIVKVNEINMQMLKLNPDLIEREGIYAFTENISGDVVVATFFGLDKNDLTIDNQPITKYTSHLNTEISDQGLKFFTILRKQIFGKYFNYFLTPYERNVRKKVFLVREMVEQIIEERLNLKLNSQSSNFENKDFVDFYIDAYLKELNDSLIKPHLKISKEEILQQFMTFFIAGTDTVGAQIAQCLYLLSKYSKYQDILFDEIQQVLGHRNLSEFSIQDFKEFTWLNAFINESFRYRPSGFGILIRRAIQNFKIFDLEIKRNDFVSVWFLSQLNPEKFDKPDQFIPERWIENDQLLKDPFTFIPFSAGPRNCIGQHMALIEIKMALIMILQNYKILDDKKPMRFRQTFLIKIDEPKTCLKLVSRKENH